MTQAGDIIFGGASGLPTRLNIGAEGRYLTVSGGSPVWAVRAGIANPMTGVGDLIRGGTAGDPTRLAPGTNGSLSVTRGWHPDVGRRTRFCQSDDHRVRYYNGRRVRNADPTGKGH